MTADADYGAVMDGRTWFRGQAEFASVITITTVSASELDVLELGSRTGAAYCQEFVDSIRGDGLRHGRMLHPVEQVSPIDGTEP